MRTLNGQRYTPRLQSRSFEAHEKLLINIPQIKRLYGPGLAAYFNFVNIVIVYNVVLTTIGIIGPSSSVFQIVVLPSTWCVCVMIVAWFLLGPIYLTWERFVRKKQQLQIYFTINDDDRISNAQQMRPKYLISCGALLAALCVTSAILYGLLQAQNSSGSGSGSGTTTTSTSYIKILLTLPVSLAFVLCNAAWAKACDVLTRLEHHITWTAFAISRTCKVLVFRLCTTITLCALTATISSTATLQTTATSFVSNIVIGFLVTDVGIGILLPLLAKKRSKQQHPEAAELRNVVAAEHHISVAEHHTTGAEQHTTGAEQHTTGAEQHTTVAELQNVVAAEPLRVPVEVKQHEAVAALSPEFNVSDAIQNIFYRQLMIHLALLVIPIGGIVACGVCCLQYLLDRVKLKYICQDPQFIEESIGVFLAINAVIIAIVSLILYPNGGLWLGFLKNLLPLSNNYTNNI